MKVCPACGKDSSSDAECTHCGIYFAKWEALHGGEPAAPAPVAPLMMSSEPPEPKRGLGWPLLTVAALAVGGGGWFFGRVSADRRVRDAYSGFREAVGSGNLAGTKAAVSGRYAEDFEGAGAGMKLQMIKALMPAKHEVTRVTVSGGEATVKVRGVKDGMTVTGTTKLVKEGGGWKVSSESWDFNISAGGESPETSDRVLDPSFPAEAMAALDSVAKLPGSPRGLAAHGGELLIGNREKPWGFIRTDARGSGGKKVEVLDHSGYNPAAFDAVVWNGKEYVSLTQPGWYVPTGSPLFNVHDPRTLKPVRHAVAPPDLGCLAWDGSSYWAATRQNTETSGEGQFLYQLDARFKVIRRLSSPAKGCQGLAWGASHLWMADVFSEDIFVVNVDGAEARTVRTYQTPLSYLSGLAFSGEDLLVVEHNDRKLWRFKKDSLGLGGTSSTAAQPPSTPRETAGDGAAQAPPAQAGGGSLMDREYAEEFGKKSVQELLAALKTEAFHKDRILNDLSGRGARSEAVRTLNEMLRDKDGAHAHQAKSLLKKIGEPVTFAWDRSSRELKEDDVSLVEWDVEMRDGRLVSAGRIHVGRDVVDGFSRPQRHEMKMPTFVRYEFRVEGPGLPERLEKSVEAERRAGDHFWSGVEVASGLGAGEYRVSLFIHAQTVGADGTPRSINNSTSGLKVERK